MDTTVQCGMSEPEEIDTKDQPKNNQKRSNHDLTLHELVSITYKRSRELLAWIRRELEINSPNALNSQHTPWSKLDSKVDIDELEKCCLHAKFSLTEVDRGAVIKVGTCTKIQ